MPLQSVLSTASAVAHTYPAALTAAQLAATIGAGGVAALVVRGRQRLTPAPVPVRATDDAPDTRRALRTRAREARGTASAITCRPQLETPPGTERVRGELEQWRSRGELDAETYLDLQRVISEVESATRP